MVVLAQQSEVYQLSDKSTPVVPDNLFHVTEFMLGAGIVAIHPSTGKIVVVWDGEERWFLPKGRKDKDESLDKTALREGYEEVRLSTPLFLGLSDPPCDIIPSNTSPRLNLQSGYQIAPLPLHSGSLDPDAPTARQGTQARDRAPPAGAGASIVGDTRKDTEPITVAIQDWDHTAVFSRGGNGEYLAFWYVRQVPDDAVSRTCFPMGWRWGFKRSISKRRSPKGPRGGNRNGV